MDQIKKSRKGKQTRETRLALALDRVQRLYNEETLLAQRRWMRAVQRVIRQLDLQMQPLAPSATAREQVAIVQKQVERLAGIEWPTTSVIKGGHIVLPSEQPPATAGGQTETQP